jgi:hypothetical protein
VIIGDVDGIERLDMVVVHFLGGVSVHLNGVESLGGRQGRFLLLDETPTSLPRNDTLARGDLNGDGVTSPIDAL